MGIYINKGNVAFESVLNSRYVDKTSFIAVVNATLKSEDQFICATRCRRFGKSMMAKTLCAYYDKSCDSRELFKGLKIAQDPSFEKHLNKYNVLYLDVTSFTTYPEYRGHIVKSIKEAMVKEVRRAFPNVEFDGDEDLMGCLQAIYVQTGERFYFIIDEWDAICREFPQRRKYKNSPVDVEPTEMDEYVMFLRRLFKSQGSEEIFVGAYLTGILPMLKFETESALNNFREYSMVTPRAAAGSFGFVPAEVKSLCDKYGMDYDELVAWYDGYQIGNEPSVFNPNSVMNAINARQCSSFWAATGAFTRVADYISMNYEGLKDDIIKMLAGGRCPVDPTGFVNNMSEVSSKDDVFTVLIHLGYLGYDASRKECYIPNMEVRGEMINAVRSNNWKEVAGILQSSRDLLEATIAGEADKVASMIDRAHQENTSILSYNDENSLSSVLSLAYIYARGEYILHRELASGKGFADLVFIPRSFVDRPAMIIELKYDKTADAAIDQIRRKEYQGKVLEYLNTPSGKGREKALLLVGINYDKESKTHTCVIEKYSDDK
ncbi:MAG: ATP-binding protein [Bacteroidaceae bacterium]|nr:ATP-binding protein [Bacteroidaceae bacterium]